MNIKKITISLLISTIILSGCGNEKLPATENDAVMLSEELESVEEYLEEAELEEEIYVEESEEETVPELSAEERISQLPDGLELNLNDDIKMFSVMGEYNGKIYTSILDFCADDTCKLIPAPEGITDTNGVIVNIGLPTCLNFIAESFYIDDDGSLYAVYNDGENRTLYKSDITGSTWTVVMENLTGYIPEVYKDYIFCRATKDDKVKFFKINKENIEEIVSYDKGMEYSLFLNTGEYAYMEVEGEDNIYCMNLNTGDWEEINDTKYIKNFYWEASYKDYIFYLVEQEQDTYQLLYTNFKERGSTPIYTDDDGFNNSMCLYDEVIYYTCESKIFAYSLLTGQIQEISQLLPEEGSGCVIYVAGEKLIYMAFTYPQEDGLNTNIYCVDLQTLEKKLIGRTYQS